MKTTIYILLTVLTIFSIHSCSDDTTVNNITQSGPFTLSGTVENWNLGGNIMLKAELYDTNFWGNNIVIDSNIVSTNGAFTLKFNIPSDSLLYPITFYSDTSCISTFTVNPSNTISSSSVGLELFNDSMTIGHIFRSNYNSDTTTVPGQFFVQYLYLNQNVSITGSIICSNMYYHDTIIYNFSGARGWNKVVVLYNTYNMYSMKVNVTANEPAGGKWYAHTWQWAGDTHSGETSFRQRIFRFNNCITCR